MIKIFTFLAASSEKRPWLVVFFVAMVTIFLLSGIAFLETDFSQESMLPGHYESVKAIEEIQDQFGGLLYENVLIVADDVTSSRLASTFMGLSTQTLEEAGIPEGQVIRVETYLDGLRNAAEARGAQVPTQGMALAIAVDQFLQTSYAQAQVVGKTITEDNKAAVIRLQLNSGVTQSEIAGAGEKLREYFSSEFEPLGAEVYVTGLASMHTDAQDFMSQQSSRLLIFALLFVMLILYVTFRRLSDVFLLLFVIVVGISWVIGLMGWASIPYTTMSVAVMPLLLGINIAYVIHILSRYYEEREADGDIFYSATNSIKTVGIAVFMTAITTVFGFSSFLITDIPPLRDFGIVCMVGIVFSFLLSITLLPAVVVIRDRRKKAEKLDSHLEDMRKRRRESRYGKMVDRGLVNAAMTAYRFHYLIACVAVALIVFAGFAIANLQTGADIRTMMGEGLPSARANDVLTEYFGAQDADVILVKGDVLEPENLEEYLKLEDDVVADGRNDSGVKGAFTREGNISIADLVAYSNGGTIPGSAGEVEDIVAELGEVVDTSSFVSEDGNSAMIMIRSDTPESQSVTDTKTRILRDAASRLEESTGLNAVATGYSVLVADLMGNIVPTQLESSALALLLCLLVLAIIFRSFSYGFVTLLVVVCGMAAEMVFLYTMGWALDIMTVTVASLIIGTGIDFGIHVTHRFREQRHDHGLSLEESVRTTVLHVGRALVAGAITTAGVFGLLGVSSMVPMRHFGLTTAVGLLAALFGALFVLPSALVILTKAMERHRGEPVEIAPEAARES
ncbi:MAG: RND family transporter [Actinobacteria bacterium]|nr:RND family transporter [Actinomycetota bacterium]